MKRFEYKSFPTSVTLIELLYSWAIFSGFSDCWNSIFCIPKMFPTFVIGENWVLDLKSSPFRTLTGCALAPRLLFLSRVCLCCLHSPRFVRAEVSSSSYLGFHVTPAVKYKTRCRSESLFSTEYATEFMYSVKGEKQASEIHYSFVEKPY